MTFADTRGKVEKIDDYFTHVRVGTALGLMLFNHQGMNAAPAALRKEGQEVFVYQDKDMLFHVRAAPPRTVIPARRKEQPQQGEVRESASGVGPASGPSAPAAAPKIPARRRT